MSLECQVRLDSIARLVQGGRHKKSGKHFMEQGYPAYGAGGLNGYLPDYEFERRAVILSAIGARCGKCFFAEGRWSSLANTQVILPDEHRADAKFLWYQLNDERSWRRSGTAQPFIKPAHAKARLVYLPPLEQQKRVVEILDKADAVRGTRQAAIGLTEALMSSIFVQAFGDPNSAGVAHPGVRGWMPLPKLLRDATGGKPKVKVSDYQTAGAIPVVDQGSREIGGYVEDESLVCDVRLPVVLFGDHTKIFKFVDYPFALGADGVKVLEPVEGVDARFAYQMLKLLHLPDDAGYSRHYKFLKTKLLPRPTDAAQAGFCRAFDSIRTIRAKLLDASAADAALFGSIAERAFRGEL